MGCCHREPEMTIVSSNTRPTAKSHMCQKGGGGLETGLTPPPWSTICPEPMWYCLAGRSAFLTVYQLKIETSVACQSDTHKMNVGCIGRDICHQAAVFKGFGHLK